MYRTECIGKEHYLRESDSYFSRFFVINVYNKVLIYIFLIQIKIFYSFPDKIDYDAENQDVNIVWLRKKTKIFW